MKRNNLIKHLPGIVILSVLATGMISCTDVLGDGMGTVIWEGSAVPEDSCYRNPVWEPDLSFPSVFSAAVGYYALGSDNEWSPGLNYTAPVLSTTDLMNWRLRGEALTDKPDWSAGKIKVISGGFAKTKGTYYIFYELENSGIGMGGSKAPQGPYTDWGGLINADSVGLSQCSNPFFLAYGSKAYIFFKGGDGMYGQEVTLNRDRLADLKGDMFKVTGSHISSIYITKLGDYYYLFGAIDDGNDSRITLGRSLEIPGPYLDRDNKDLLDGGGSDVLKGNPDNGFTGVNHTGGVFEDANGDIWILYQATDIDRPLLSSGSDRHPMMLNRLKFDGDGWPGEVIESKGGWNYPKFAK